MKKDFDLIIVGLGNPGEEYTGTRHNVGFLAVDEIYKNFSGSGGNGGNRADENLTEAFEKNTKAPAEFIQLTSGPKNIILVKPLGYMNKSGEVLRKFFYYEGLIPKPQEIEKFVNKIMIICDDADQSEGHSKLVEKGGSGGHNGLNNIFQVLGTQEIKRLKIGIRPENNQERSQHFVLKHFSKEGPLAEKIKETPEIIQCLLTKDFAFCQSLYN